MIEGLFFKPCNQKLDPILVRRLTGDAEFERYDAHLLNFAIRSMSHTVWCPKIECQHPAQVSGKDRNIARHFRLVIYKLQQKYDLNHGVRINSKYIYQYIYKYIYTNYSLLSVCRAQVVHSWASWPFE